MSDSRAKFEAHYAQLHTSGHLIDSKIQKHGRGTIAILVANVHGTHGKPVMQNSKPSAQS